LSLTNSRRNTGAWFLRLRKIANIGTVRKAANPISARGKLVTENNEPHHAEGVARYQRL